MRRFAKIVLLAIAVVGASEAQTPAEAPGGLKPFASATVTWFGPGDRSDTLTFYSYWTGYVLEEAALHWIVRWDLDQQAKPTAPRQLSTTWAWSDTCPQLAALMRMFQLPAEASFAANRTEPRKLPSANSGEAAGITVLTMDGHWISFWAETGGFSSTSIKMSGPWSGDYNGDSIGRVLRLFEGKECGDPAPPQIQGVTG